MKFFRSLEEIRQVYPGAYSLIVSENEAQYPNATFIIAGLEDEGTEYESLNVFFDVGVKDEILWVWPSGDMEEEDGGYIDEYYLISIEDANKYHLTYRDKDL